MLRKSKDIKKRRSKPHQSTCLITLQLTEGEVGGDHSRGYNGHTFTFIEKICIISVKKNLSESKVGS